VVARKVGREEGRERIEILDLLLGDRG